ncbi:hypothetical protein D3C73_1047260 [compost metagenome]
MAQTFDQPHRVDEEGADDRRIQAFVVEHQHRFIQARLRVHDKSTGAGLHRLAAQIRRDETLTVHQRHVQVSERRHRTAAAIRRQAGDTGPLQEKREQLGLGENPRDQFAVLEVVGGQRRLVLGEHAVDFVHALVRRADRLAFAEQGLRDIFQAERREAPGGRAQGFDAIDDQPPGGRGEVMVAAAMFAPLHLFTAAPQPQRHRQPSGVFVQHAQVELHDIPADDRVRVMAGKPFIELFQQGGA